MEDYETYWASLDDAVNELADLTNHSAQWSYAFDKNAIVASSRPTKV